MCGNNYVWRKRAPLWVKLCLFLLTFLWPVFVTCYYNQVGETVYMFNLLFIDLFLLRVIIVKWMKLGTFFIDLFVFVTCLLVLSLKWVKLCLFLIYFLLTCFCYLLWGFSEWNCVSTYFLFSMLGSEILFLETSSVLGCSLSLLLIMFSSFTSINHEVTTPSQRATGL